MIARIWRAATLASDVDQYIEYLKEIIMPGYQAADGNRGIFILQEIRGEIAHILLLSLWESHQALIKFAGQDIRIAEICPEERKFLIAFQSTFTHYRVVNGVGTFVKR